ncbi:HAD-IA family hydrolase [uncultured Paludibaculum sp.]|uniref:HAD-IA family hydrolase n=1 Tax=uncultured Paludibaculum sp. TaxID=1765020 RepID=UPI002AAA8A21|nr:HAD-IA family hydrolase [uncultured Paludibaculum sp.]
MTFDCDAILFDLDGTLVDSHEVVVRYWRRFADQHGLDVDKILAVSHGRRTAETIHMFVPGIDAAAAALEFNRAEELDTDGVVQIAGAAALLASLPPERWTVVTSCPRKLAEVRLAAAGLPVPAGMVTSEEVVTGKPDPYCFLLGAERLGVRPERCLVFEDAPAGVQAGLSAGMRVVQLGQDIPNYLGVQYVPNGGGAFGIRVGPAKSDLPGRK